MTFLDAEPFSNAPRFPEVLAVATKSGDAIYQVRIEGVDKFELYGSNDFLGYYPVKFMVELELTETSDVTSNQN